jgi:hypothetical protein
MGLMLGLQIVYAVSQTAVPIFVLIEFIAACIGPEHLIEIPIGNPNGNMPLRADINLLA